MHRKLFSYIMKSYGKYTQMVERKEESVLIDKIAILMYSKAIRLCFI